MDQAPSPTPRFFGYGSLVNRATHAYPQVRQQRVHGWARAWRHTSLRSVAFLTAIPDPNCAIDGLTAAVPGADWSALDAREFAYNRVILPDDGTPAQTAIYAIAEDAHGPASTVHPVLLSYLDVVAQGYFREYGAQGVADFFATTRGWDAPILNDRSAPRYPRHQRLSAEETALVDDALKSLGCDVIGA